MSSVERMSVPESVVSVIIPAYNVESWLPDALDSVLAQGNVIKECIVVDDGSTDATLVIARDYADRHDIFRVISLKNSGVSAARNKALEMVSGDWLVFLDADDILLPGSVGLLLRCALIYKCDIVEGRVSPFRTMDQECRARNRFAHYAGGRRNFRSNIVTGLKAAELSLYQTDVNSSLYAKIYRRPLWDDIRMPEGEIYEDLSVFYKVAMRASRYLIIDIPVYLYRERSESQIHSFNKARLVVLEVTERICLDFRHRMKAESDESVKWRKMLRAADDRRLSACFNMIGLLLNNRFEGREVIIRDCLDYIRKKSSASLLNPNVRSKNRIGAFLSLILPESYLKKLLKNVYS